MLSGKKVVSTRPLPTCKIPKLFLRLARNPAPETETKDKSDFFSNSSSFLGLTLRMPLIHDARLL